jgi:hypothetical protein
MMTTFSSPGLVISRSPHCARMTAGIERLISAGAPGSSGSGGAKSKSLTRNEFSELPLPAIGGHYPLLDPMFIGFCG